MQIIEKKLTDIEPYRNNPRRNDDAVDAVAESIKRFGFKVPIIIDKDGIIVAGHTRYKASKKLNLETVPCIVADDLTEEQIKAFRLADNKVAELAEWDFELLGEELEDIVDFDMAIFGFDEVEDADADPEPYDDDYDLEPPEEPVSQRGEIYQLGNHRLMVGDSTSQEDVQRLVEGHEIDLVVTDPPYNVAISNSKGDTIENDDFKDTEQFYEFILAAFVNLEENLKAGGAFYVWHASRTQKEFERALNEVGLEVREQLIWNKNALVLGRQDYQWKHEPCFYGWKDGEAHYFCDSRKETTVIEDKGLDIKHMSKAELYKTLEKILQEKIATTVMEYNKPVVNNLHPTMKPVELIGYQVKNSSRKGETVLDLFGGSGTTLIACEQLGRCCYMMEYDPKYADCIIDRWEQLTGKKAKKL